jgi:hypothetical protein
MAASIVGENSLGPALVPGGHQLLGVLEDLAIGCPACSGFLLGLLPARSSILRLLKPMAGSSAGTPSTVKARRSR